ncbi:hypothetical protein [Paenarthrobacter sp. PH39-S1]|uniref:hypothetical protein n=1 Tax=Paenarthrobacter sp. PH39-S1 TaxID=3046204 RepID=UPI0024B97457|nr:hypothetical protein [Paenarthrobacter sp. PH39-S1]MDJ0356185.1 hypothetical protein [Paenarthrobacter sp. PH39-S1]
MDVEQVLRSLGGAARTEALVQRGFTTAQLARAVAGKQVQTRERGILAVPGAPAAFVQALRHRGVLTCASAAGQYGLWVVAEPCLIHLAVGNGLRGPETGPQPVLYSAPRAGPHPVPLPEPRTVLHAAPLSCPVTGAPVAALEDVLIHALFCLPIPESVVMVESAVNQGLVDPEVLRRHLPASRDGKARTALDLVEEGADSPWETLARILFRRFGFEVQAQSWVHGVGVVHFLIDGYLVAEIVGLERRPPAGQFASAPWRDAAAGISGHVLLRIQYPDVLYRPQRVAERVQLALRARRPTRTRRPTLMAG